MAGPDEASRISQVAQLADSVHAPILAPSSDYIRMGILVSIYRIDDRIALYQLRLSILSRLDPSRPIVVLGMVLTRLKRHMLSNEWEDLDRSIFDLTESIFLPGRLWLEHGPLIFQALFLLSLALVMRSTWSQLPYDAIYAGKYLRHLRDQPPQASGIPRHEVTALFVDVLAFQVELEAGNVLENIGEMAVLCRELLNWDMSYVDITRSITLLSIAVMSKIRPRVPDQPLDQVIESLRVARMHRSNLREARFALALSLGCRYCVAFRNTDYEEAASVLDEIDTSSSPGNSQDELVAKSQEFATILAMFRMAAHQTPEYSEEAIDRVRAFLDSPSVQEPFHSAIVFGPEAVAKQRFRYFDSIEGLEAPAGNSPLSQTEPVVSLWEHEDNVAEFGRNTELLVRLLSRVCNNDITKISEAIEEARILLPSSASRGPDASFLFEIFGEILFKAFGRTNKIEHLDESISIRRRVLKNSSPQILHSTTLHQLSLSFITRLATFPGHSTQDVDEALEFVSQCLNDGHLNSASRSQLACAWAHVARHAQPSSVSVAYESTMSLRQDLLRFAPTLQLQHTTLAMTDVSHSVPMDYTSYQIDLHQLEKAIETLERGRTLLWSEMRRLRTSVDPILQIDPQLGRKFVAINQDLDELTKSATPSHKLSTDDGASDDLVGVDPFGRLLLNQRRLLKERDNPIPQIRTLPGLSTFLTSPSFETLRSAASSGPVVIINHSKWRSDILILLHDTSPSLIPTPDDFYDRTSALKEKLLDSRHKYGLDSSDHDQALASVLAELYKLVGEPVIDRLRQLKVPEQSRIWWCPTSAFCSLPLHAMGPIPSYNGEKSYFMDLYICSYTPTLSALIQSRICDLGSRSSERPSLLLVAQPNSSLPDGMGEIQVVQGLDTEVRSLISEAATPAAVIDGFRHHKFVHISCHGILEPGRPFDAAFEFHGGKRLTLLEIVRLHLPAAEFAFLSVCHSAEITEGSIPDEVLHLVAAVQYCGFRSVVGTMWAMEDEDGRDLAEFFYQALFSTSRQDEGIPYYERSAKALQFAVKKLRMKRRITLERWVNFVHYGA